MEDAPEYTIEALLPANEVDEIDDLHVVLVAQREAEIMDDGSEARVVDDEELLRPVVELLGRACLVFPCSAILRHLILHVKNVDRFMSLEIEVVDDSKTYRTIDLSSRRSIATVDSGKAELPLVMGDAWQLVHIDLEDLTFRAYGTRYLSAVQVKVGGSCRIGKAFFADQVYPDPALPPFLRVVGPQ